MKDPCFAVAGAITARPRATRPRATCPRMSGESRVGVVEVHSAAALQASVSRAAEVPVAVVGFTQAGCRACAYAKRAYDRVARDADGAFFSVDVSAPALRDACRAMDVRAVPSWGIFAADGNGEVFEVHRVVGPRAVRELDEVVQEIVDNGFDPDMFEEA